MGCTPSEPVRCRSWEGCTPPEQCSPVRCRSCRAAKEQVVDENALDVTLDVSDALSPSTSPSASPLTERSALTKAQVAFSSQQSCGSAKGQRKSFQQLVEASTTASDTTLGGFLSPRKGMDTASVAFSFSTLARSSSKSDKGLQRESSSKDGAYSSSPYSDHSPSLNQFPQRQGPRDYTESKDRTDAATDFEATGCGRPPMNVGLVPFRRRRDSITQQTSQWVSTSLQYIIENPGQIANFYTFKKQVLGKGNSGSVKVAVVKASGARRAVKIISKGQIEDDCYLAREIRILKMVDHLHVVKLYETFEDDENLYLVMALSSYGHLARYVETKGHVSEIVAKQAMRNLVSAINYLHNNLIIHRDVKPQNVLVHIEKPLSLRLTDFGLARTFLPEQVFSADVGSPTYMAPEVFRKSYTEACDVWACGITMYFLLCDYLPFTGGTVDEIKRKVMNDDPKYETVEWVDVSQNTLAFLELLLKKNPYARYTANQAFHHEWLEVAQQTTGLAEMPMDMIEHLRTFRKGNKLKRSALTLIASMLKTEDVMASHEVFAGLDANGDGNISMPEMYHSMKSIVEAGDVEAGAIGQMFERDITEEVESGSKPFSYTEFIAATFDRKRCITKPVLKAAFACYDKDGDGMISMTELATGQLLGHLSMEEMAKTLGDLDSNRDSYIDQEEFLQMLLTD